MNTKIIKKIALVLICVVIINVAIPLNTSNAGFTGVLTKPIAYICMGILDAINSGITLLVCGAEAYEDMANAMDAGDGLDEAVHNNLIGPDKIFAGEVAMVDANIFDVPTEKSWKVSGDGLISALKTTISSIYVALRNLSALILLCLLIYTGIRIVLSSNSVNDRMKWRMLLFDWVKALCLVIFVHLIMIGVFYVSDLIVDAIGDIAYSGNSLIFQIRQQLHESSWLDGTQQIVLVIMYGYITYLTIVFVISYMKRLMWTMILIVIAPIVSIAYAIGPSQKQIFNRWFKEFVMNVLIQPYHLLIYWILISIPLGLMESNGGGLDYFSWIYALVAMSFIRPAEMFLRKLLGFDTEVARTASFESGKQTLDHGKDFVKSVASTVAAVYTGGASMAVTGGKVALASTGAQTPDPTGAGPTNSAAPTDPSVQNPADPANPGGPSGTNQGVPETKWEKAARTIEQGTSPIESLKEKFGESQFAGRLTNVGHKIYNWEPVKKARESGPGQVALSLGHRIGNSVRYLATEEGQRKIQKLRSDAHELNDTLYLGGAPRDWKFNVDVANAKIKQTSEENLKQYINNEKNIKAIIEANGFKDDKYSTAKEKAKAKLEKATPYLDRGISDVYTINNLIDFQKENGLSVDDAIKGYMKQASTVQKTTNFVLNTNNQTEINKISEKVTGHAWDPNNNDIRKAVEEAIIPYIDRGINKPEQMAQLIGDEIALKRNGMSLPNGREKAVEVLKIEKLLSKALKEGFDGVNKKIEFSNVKEKDKTPALKKQEEALNKTLNDIINDNV